MEEPIRGEERVRSLLFSFLVPPHAMAEVGGMSISIRETAIPGDVTDETHVCVDTGVGRRVRESHVVRHHLRPRQSGEPLTHDDLGFDEPEAATGFQRPS